MNYGQPVAQWIQPITILTIVMVLVIVAVLVRDLINQFRFKNMQADIGAAMKRNREGHKRLEEQHQYYVEQNTIAQAKRDEQIRLLNELVELERQSVKNQKEILDILKSR